MQKRRSLVYRITMGKDNLPDFTPDKLPGTRFALFKDVFLRRLGVMFRLNMLVLLFALPLIGVILYYVLTGLFDNSMIPHAGNVGIGWPIIPDIGLMVSTLEYSRQLMLYVLMIPSIIILTIGLAGGFYVMRRIVWGEGQTVFVNFFRGIKKHFIPFLIAGVAASVIVFALMMNITAHVGGMIPPAVSIIGIIATVILATLFALMLLFYVTQAVTYKQKIVNLVKNSFFLALGLVPQTVIMLIFSAVPFVLLALLSNVGMIFMIIIMVVMMVGFSYLICIWTVYAHWAFDRFINGKIEGFEKNRGMRPNADEKKEKAKKEKEKRKLEDISSIDEGSSITPLGASFSRTDLAKLQDEKATVKQEIDAEFTQNDEITDNSSDAIVLEEGEIVENISEANENSTSSQNKPKSKSNYKFISKKKK
ncbi:MAG: hypothetical protein FWC11_00855 [Firmicutes bacterium]|nr:hypothetical protein [Bacillota bacterium]MCL2255391.1 hypothetical protein [Bacillota bacterium]